MKNTKAQALAQIFILVLGTIAVAWMIGSEVRVVSADAGEDTCGNGKIDAGENCKNCPARKCL